MNAEGSPNIFPALRYRDANAAIEFLKGAFGFEEQAVYRADDGSVQHAQLRLGAGMIMLGEAGEGGAGAVAGGVPATGTPPITIYIVVPDPTRIAPARRRPAPRSCASRSTRTTAAATTAPAIPTATCGRSGPTTRTRSASVTLTGSTPGEHSGSTTSCITVA